MQIDAQLAKLAQIMKTDVPAFNQLVRDQNIPAVTVKPRRVGYLLRKDLEKICRISHFTFLIFHLVRKHWKWSLKCELGLLK